MQKIKENVTELNAYILELEIKLKESREAESALKESDTRYRLLLDNSLDAILLTTPSGKIISANKAACEMFGYTEEELCRVGRNGIVDLKDPKAIKDMSGKEEDFIGKNLVDVYGPITGIEFLKRINLASVSENYLEYEDYLELPSGKYWFLSVFTRITDTNGEVIGVKILSHDISARKFAEEAHWETEQKFKAIASNTPNHILMQDKDLRYTFIVNPQLGIGEKDIIGKTDLEILGDKEGAEITRIKMNVLESRKPSHTEIHLKNINGEIEYFDGSYVPLFNKNGDSEGLLGYFRNVTSYKVREETLKKNLQQLNLIYNNVSDSIFYLSVEPNNKYVFELVNNKFLLLTGLEKSQIIKRLLTDIIPETVYEKMNSKCREAITSKKTVSWNGIINNPGGNRNGIISVTPVFNEQGRCSNLVGVVHDTTELTTAEEINRIAEERYRDLFLNMLEGYAFCKMIYNNEGAKDFIYLTVNPQFETLTGLKDIIGKNFTSIIPDLTESDKEIIGIYARVATTGISEKFDIYMNSMKMWFQVSVFSPGKEYFVAIFDVINERKHAEEILASSERDFRLLSEHIPQIVWITQPDGLNIFFNQQWVDYTGMTMKESYGQGWNKPFHPEDQKRAMDAWQYAVANKGPYSLECRLKRKDGIYLWWLIRGVPVFNEYEKIIKWFGTCTNIDDFKKAKDNQEQSYKQVQELAEHLQTIREDERVAISRDIHDDMGQVFTALKIELSLMQNELLNNNTVNSEFILSEIKGMEELINMGIQSVRKLIKELRPEVLDNFGLIKTLKWQTEEFEKRTCTKCSFVSDIEDLDVEKNKSIAIYRILQESLTNIVRHANATLVIIRLSFKNNTLLLSIEDNGSGFSPEEFNEGKSMGIIGMRERTLILGGEFNIKTEKGAGTTVLLSIPVMDNKKVGYGTLN